VSVAPGRRHFSRDHHRMTPEQMTEVLATLGTTLVAPWVR
jgi:hypothetical protein